ncbi:hypothetical protein O7626_39780 [Micromonospora sp. WMMD1102]|uniref:hypothetical protein n=1 Tax=Micromonospora sp. WMMD1102 TaxID=3016105 RepID=UPI0024156284|nr:hypothetical protein [Micromonospora sp. WMMD1102]MDG4791956.1 hypothetical protein [Micromonospora sp. WMMD1102]
MRGITVRYPWAACIATGLPGAKRVENRGATTAYRGALLVHAGKTADVKADTDPRVMNLFGRDPRLGWPTGCVIAVANLVDAHQANLDGCCKPWGEDWHYGPRSARIATHLVLADVRRLPRPVPCRGALGLWTPPADVIAAVEAQYTDIEVAR